MSDPIMGVVPMTNIHVKEGHNPRTNFDPNELACLAASVEATAGLVQPLAVEPIEGKPGHYWIIDGERRWRILNAAEVAKAPIFIPQSENAKLAASAANVMRADLNPIEEARSIKAAAVLENAKTNKEIAKATGFGEGHVAGAMRLLKLPDSVQAHIAAGYVPLDAEPNLRKASKYSVRLADSACQLVRDEVVEGRDLVSRFGEVVTAVAESDLPDRPTMIDIGRPEPLGSIVTDPDLYGDLAERSRKITGAEPGIDPVIRFGTEEVDAARAGNVLIEFPKGTDWRGDPITTLYVTDEAWAVDLATRVIERAEKQAKEEAERAEAAAAEAGGSADDAAEKAKQEERDKRKKSRKTAEAAHERNIAVGRSLMTRRGAKNRKENKLAWAKAAAVVILRDNENLPAASLGLAFEQLQTIEYKTIKVSNEQQKKVTYASPETCRKYLWDRIEEARTAEQVWELLGEALIAAVMVDPEAVPRSRRVNYWLRSGQEVASILAEQAKSLRPRGRSKRSS
ncbi:MAG TPA: ParB/RepB/Spo0J family partition protein [Solirubrobacterales bacterium]|jgi:ParB/RepB/Spo0J family partition protein|nr:ParB/RepB/Spo0J family partition protein [Solirubrobacterales bacterium]